MIALLISFYYDYCMFNEEIEMTDEQKNELIKWIELVTKQIQDMVEMIGVLQREIVELKINQRSK